MASSLVKVAAWMGSSAPGIPRVETVGSDVAQPARTRGAGQGADKDEAFDDGAVQPTTSPDLQARSGQSAPVRP